MKGTPIHLRGRDRGSSFRKRGCAQHACPVAPFFIYLVLCVFGCMYPLSKQTRSEIDHTVTFSELRKNPDSFAGTVVVLGGEIVAIENEQDTTLLEVLQKRVDLFMKPRDEDATGGRFLVLVSGFLDPAVYTEGRRITVAAQVSGKRTQRLGNSDYVYPFLKAKELYLWPDYPERVYYPYPALYFWDTYHFPYPPWL